MLALAAPPAGTPRVGWLGASFSRFQLAEHSEKPMGFLDSDGRQLDPPKKNSAGLQRLLAWLSLRTIFSARDELVARAAGKGPGGGRLGARASEQPRGAKSSLGRARWSRIKTTRSYGRSPEGKFWSGGGARAHLWLGLSLANLAGLRVLTSSSASQHGEAGCTIVLLGPVGMAQLLPQARLLLGEDFAVAFGPETGMGST